MKKRNPYSDLGMIVAVSVFICIIIKCLLFGFTWGGIAWLIISCVYFFISWKYPSDGRVVKLATNAFLILSVLTAFAVVMFDKKAMPKMHAFEGTGDTIQDVQYVDEGPVVEMRDIVPVDTTHVDTLSVELDGDIDMEGHSEEENEYEVEEDTIGVLL